MGALGQLVPQCLQKEYQGGKQTFLHGNDAPETGATMEASSWSY